MANEQSKMPSDADPGSLELVPVIFAANTNEAEFYQTLLADAGIEADIDAEQQAPQPGRGVAILVSPDSLDEASDIITVREQMEAHVLAEPDALDTDDDDDEDELTAHPQDDDNDNEEDVLFRRDPFLDEEND